MMKDKKVVGLSELPETATDLDVKLIACSMSMDVMEIAREDLIDEVSDVVGVAAYIKEASESKITLFT
jgi:peroxiredoxin family protein